MKRIIATLAAIGGIAAAGEAQAHGTKTLFYPYVEEGALEAEAKSIYVVDDEARKDSWGSELSMAYGVTSFWEAELGVTTEDEGRGEDSEFTAIIFENKFQLTEPGALFIDPGVKIEYARSLTGGADEIGAKLLLAKKIDKISAVANFGIAKEIGENSSDDEEYGFGYGMSYEVQDNLALGLEWHSDFGNFDNDFDEQEHQFGPVAYGEAFGVEYEAGVLVGVSRDAPDATLKFALGYEF